MSDEFGPTSEPRRGLWPVASFLVALRFLTRLPVPFIRTIDPPPLAVAMSMFPVAGAVVGGLAGTVLVLAGLAGFPELFCAVLAVAANLLITGGFHEDGLADVVDGFGGGRTREERLNIMRDSRIGAFGTLALCLAILGKASLLTVLLDLPWWQAIVLLAAAGAFSRALVVDLLWATRPARGDGLSVMAGRPTRATTLVALAIAGLGAGAAIALVLAPAASVVALGAGVGALAVVRALAIRKIGGQTGDVCGAGQVLSEIAMLAVIASGIFLP